MMLTARYANLSTNESDSQDIATWNEEKCRATLDEIQAEGLRVLGAERMAQLRAEGEAARVRRRAEIDRALGRVR